MKKKRRKRKRLTAEEEQAKIDAYLRGTPKKPIPPAYARGAQSGPTAKPRAKKKSD